MKPIIRSYLTTPRIYQEDIVDQARQHLSKKGVHASRLGTVLYDSIFVRIDLITSNNIPIIVVCDTLKRDKNKTDSIQNLIRYQAARTNDWIAKIKPNSLGESSGKLIFNIRHPTYIQILLAMAVTNATSGIVILCETLSNHFEELPVAYNAVDKHTILQRTLLCYQHFAS